MCIVNSIRNGYWTLNKECQTGVEAVTRILNILLVAFCIISLPTLSGTHGYPVVSADRYAFIPLSCCTIILASTSKSFIKFLLNRSKDISKKSARNIFSLSMTAIFIALFSICIASGIFSFYDSQRWTNGGSLWRSANAIEELGDTVAIKNLGFFLAHTNGFDSVFYKHALNGTIVPFQVNSKVEMRSLSEKLSYTDLLYLIKSSWKTRDTALENSPTLIDKDIYWKMMEGNFNLLWSRELHLEASECVLEVYRTFPDSPVLGVTMDMMANFTREKSFEYASKISEPNNKLLK